MRRIIPLVFFLGLFSLFMPQALADIGDGLVGYWPFNGNSNDKSGNGNHSTEFGNLCYVDGKVLQAASFDGNSAYILTPELNLIENEITIALWIKMKNAPVESVQFIEASTAIGEIHLETRGGTSSKVSFCVPNSTHLYSTPLPVEEFVHIVAVFSSSNRYKKIYLNGVIDAQTISGGTANITTDFAIGRDPERPIQYMDGLIDELFIYNRALSEEEIKELYELSSIIYVDSGASGANDGTSWTDAYTNLQDALSVPETGVEIWVAAGTYKPTAGADRTISFVLADGVRLYGGFAGGETELDQRDWESNITTLIGDIGIVEDDGDNSYHVVKCGSLTRATVLDGFTITGGNADGADPTTGAEGCMQPPTAASKWPTAFSRAIWH